VHRLSVAPMMDITDRHFRWVFRRISRSTLLYTEMITTGALLHGDAASLLGHDDVEHPVALQLGGDDPVALARCARLGEEAGYCEINLNVGCPSPRVQRGSFGVSLMGRPARVAECVAAMKAAVSVPVTVKHRIGFDDIDRYEDMLAFVQVVAAGGCDGFIVHARKAWLEGLSPKDNRTIPPLRHEEVWRLKDENRHLWVATNGGIRSLHEARVHLERCDSVMIGRFAAEQPLAMAELARELLNEPIEPLDPAGVAESCLAEVERWEGRGIPGKRITRHLMELMSGRPGARAWRRRLGEQGGSEGLRAAVLEARRAAASSTGGVE
jgi:tRNA-dihydrouridine synthase A